MTITEGGYYIDPASGAFNPAHPDIVHDAIDAANPKTVFGLIAAGLARRRARAHAALYGHVVRQHPAQWQGHRRRRHRADAGRGVPASRTGSPTMWRFRTAWSTGSRPPRPIASESFWRTNSASKTIGRSSASRSGNGCWKTISPTGRPALEEAGVTFVNDVSPYELMKIRILNGGHAAIAYPAALMDIHFVHEAMEEPLIRNFLAKLEREEIIPTVPPVPDTDIDDYFQLIEQALLQSEDRRHHPAALPGRLQPAAEIHPACRRGPACGRRRASPACRWFRRCGAGSARAQPTAASRRTTTTPAPSG